MHRVLVIDDNHDILLVVDTFLKYNNIITKGVSDGRDVLDEIASFKPDLILLDIKLGDLDGRLICKQLKTNYRTSHIPVILFSALQNISQTLKDCGMVDFIAKPFDLQEMIAKINQHIIPKPDLNTIKKQVIQILVDRLGVNHNECSDQALIKKDLSGDDRDISMILTDCEKMFRLDFLKKYLTGDIAVLDLVNVIKASVEKD